MLPPIGKNKARFHLLQIMASEISPPFLSIKKRIRDLHFDFPFFYQLKKGFMH